MSKITKSVFLSLYPFNRSKRNSYNIDEDFLYVCSNCYPSYDVSYGLSTMGIYGQGTEGAIVVDAMTGAVGRVNVSGQRIGDEKYGSNAYFAKEIRRMRSVMQLKENAYVLRIYNSELDTIDKCTDIKDSYKDFYVYLKDVSFSVKGGQPKVLDVTLGLIQRNKYQGFNKYDDS